VPADPPPLPELPACDRACDRVVACGVAACPGVEWATSPRLFDTCYLDCNTTFAASVLDAPDCAAALEPLFERERGFDDRCEEDPCAPVCDRLAHCVVEVCPALGAQVEANLASDCRRDCSLADAAWVLEARTCEDVVRPIADNDPGFHAACYGARRCPAAAPCNAYARKVTRCVLEHCDGSADPFADGLEAAFFGYCSDDPSCPSEEDIEWILSSRVSCETPPLEEIGRVPPLNRLCAGPDHLSPEAAATACQRLHACYGGGDADLCMVQLTLREDALATADCIHAARGCTARGACLGEQ